MRYKIVWQSKTNPECKGEGQPCEDLRLLEAWIFYANNHYPDLDHNIIQCE